MIGVDDRMIGMTGSDEGMDRNRGDVSPYIKVYMHL